MNNCFCTIITSNYYAYALALHKSLKNYDHEVLLYVFVVDDKPLASTRVEEGMKVMPVQTLMNYSLVDDLYRKYAHIDMDFFRWTLKPVLISYLLENGFEKVLYTDCDIYFFDNYQFLFEQLDNYSILLTRHWFTSDPLLNENGFIQLLTTGVFNAGFIGSSKKGLPALHWWANACHFKTGVFKDLGIHDDQRYLDLLPCLFDDINILTHRGCNLGALNYEECRRELVGNRVLINGQYPVVFIHFSRALVKQILMGFDPLLRPHFNEYQETMQKNGIPEGALMNELDYYSRSSLLMKLKWRILLRTRIKSFLYTIAKRL